MPNKDIVLFKVLNLGKQLEFPIHKYSDTFLFNNYSTISILRVSK